MRIGVITSPHGVHGEVKVYPTTDDPKRFREVGSVIVARAASEEKMNILSARYFKDLVILKLSGIPDRNAAETYRKAEILIRRHQSPPLRPGEYFIGDILGCTAVTEDGREVGTVTDVLRTGANDVYVVKKGDGKELLLPKIPDCILDVDPENKRMTVCILPGLEDGT